MSFTQFSRGRSLRLDSELASNMNNKHGVSNGGKKVRQFTTRSRSKSAASFKGLNRLRRVLSHDGTFEVEEQIKDKGNTMKKSKSSDSLSRKRAISGLSMTRLGKVHSHPGVSTAGEQNGGHTSHSGLLGGGLKPQREKSVKSVLEMRNGDSEFYEDHSTTDEEVEYFTDEEQESRHNSQESPLRQLQPRDTSQDLRQDSQPDYTQEQEQNVEDSEEDHTLMGSDEGTSAHNVLEQSQDDLVSKDSHNTVVNNQLSYRAPSNLRDQNDDHISNEDRIGNENDLNDVRNVGGDDHIGDDHIGGDDLRAEDRSSDNNNDEDTINADSHMESVTNSLRRQGAIPKTVERGSVNRVTSQNGNENTHGLSPPKRSERYSPVMILSQSTGIEKRFDRSSMTGQPIPRGIQKVEDTEPEINKAKVNNNFNYINSDFAASFTSNNIPERHTSITPKPDFSTSISSLSNHLHKPAQVLNDNRSNILLQQRAGQGSPANTNRSSVETQKLNDSRGDSLSNFNNFAQFLQSENNGTESRTQQKLWLQRENSIMDLSASNSNADAIYLASNIEVKREFERISREYTNVRRFSNPLNASLNRVVPLSKIEVKKLRSNYPQGDELSKVFRSDLSRDKKSFQEFCKQNLSQKLDIDRMLTKIWNDESAEFKKGSDYSIDNDNKDPSLLPSHRSSNRHSLRNAAGSTGNVSHLRALSSLQPTTRAVHRRMENALSQQRL